VKSVGMVSFKGMERADREYMRLTNERCSVHEVANTIKERLYVERAK